MTCNRIGRDQKGVSLISLMVGLTISMVAVLAMAAIYKTTLKTAGDSSRGATTDGQRLAAIFTAQNLLQGAGYGIDTAKFGDDLILLSSGAALNADGNKLTGTVVSTLPVSTGGAVIWGGKTESGAYMCDGFLAPATGGLKRLSPVACASAKAGWNVVSWTPFTLVADTRRFSIGLQAATSGCKSFGIAGSGGYLATFSTTNSTATGANGADTPVTGTVCLTNFQPNL